MFGLLVTIGSYVLYVFLQSEVLCAVIYYFGLPLARSWSAKNCPPGLLSAESVSDGPIQPSFV
jgi:hypothetical protein